MMYGEWTKKYAPDFVARETGKKENAEHSAWQQKYAPDFVARMEREDSLSNTDEGTVSQTVSSDRLSVGTDASGGGLHNVNRRPSNRIFARSEGVPDGSQRAERDAAARVCRVQLPSEFFLPADMVCRLYGTGVLIYFFLSGFIGYYIRPDTEPFRPLIGIF